MKIPEGWPTEEMINAGMKEYQKRLTYTEIFSSKKAFTAAFQAALSAAPTPPAQDEPVAVIDECDEGKFADLLPEGTFLKRGTKLYAHPQSDKLREAAEEVLRCFDSSSARYSIPFESACEIMRAVLEGK